MNEPIIQPVSDETAQRRTIIADRWNRYDGEHPESLKIAPGDPDDNVSLNNLATIVDTGVDFLFGGELEFTVTRDDTEADDETTWLDAVWKANRKKTFLRKLGTSGAIAGQFAIKIIADADARGMHRLVNLDPCDFDVQFDDEDIDRVVGYTIDRKVGEVHGAAIIKREQHTIDEHGQSWTVRYFEGRVTSISDGFGVRTAIRWVQIGEDVAWPHPFPAIVDGQNLPAPHQYWGRADLTPDIMGLSAAINRVSSNEQRTLRLFAHPQPVAIGEKPKDLQGCIDSSIGATLCLPAGSSMFNLEMQADGLTAAAAFRESLEDKLFEVARTPRVAAGKVEGIGALSGVALLILYRPLIAKTDTKRDTYGDALDELNRRLLILAGFAEGFDLDISWPNALPKNDKDEAETALLDKDLGFSQHTLILRRGGDPDVEAERRAEEDLAGGGDMHGITARLSEQEPPPVDVPTLDDQSEA